MNESRANILIIDREPEWQRFSAQVLNTRGYKVEACTTTEKAMQELDDNGFDLVIVDAVLSNLIDTIATGHTDKRLLVTTTSPSVSEAIMAFRRGALDYVKKVFDRTQLLNAVSDALEKEAIAQRMVA